MATGNGSATGFSAGSGNINQSLNLPPNSSVTYKATGFINGTSGTVISNTANVSVPAGATDVITADKQPLIRIPFSKTSPAAVILHDHSSTPGKLTRPRAIHCDAVARYESLGQRLRKRRCGPKESARIC